MVFFRMLRLTFPPWEAGKSVPPLDGLHGAAGQREPRTRSHGTSPADTAGTRAPCNNLDSVKHLRLVLLLLLAVLLPIRGAVAAAMMCPPATGAQQATVMERAGGAHADGAVNGMDHAHGHGHHHAEPAGESSDGHQHSSSVGAQDKCNLCAASCFVTPLVSDPLNAPQPPEVVTRVPPDLNAPAPSFLSDGQERPPRSI